MRAGADSFPRVFHENQPPLRGVPDGKEEGGESSFRAGRDFYRGKRNEEDGWADDRSVTAPVAVHDREREEFSLDSIRKKEQRTRKEGRNKVGIKFLDRGEK